MMDLFIMNYFMIPNQSINLKFFVHTQSMKQSGFQDKPNQFH